MKSSKIKAPKPMKARRMWANYHGDTTIVFKDKSEAEFCAMSGPTTRAVVPVAVIPLDDPDALIDVAGHAFSAAHDGHLCKSDIVAMLTAIGALPKQRKGRK